MKVLKDSTLRGVVSGRRPALRRPRSKRCRLDSNVLKRESTRHQIQYSMLRPLRRMAGEEERRKGEGGEKVEVKAALEKATGPPSALEYGQ